MSYPLFPLYGLSAGLLIAALFAAVGIRLGLTLTKTKEVVLIREVPVPTLPGATFLRDDAKIAELGITPRELEILKHIASGKTRAFQVGLLIAVVSALCYVATWQIVSRTVMTDFPEKYTAHLVEKARAEGKSPQEIEATRQEITKNMEMLKDPVISLAIVFSSHSWSASCSRSCRRSCSGAKQLDVHASLQPALLGRAGRADPVSDARPGGTHIGL